VRGIPLATLPLGIGFGLAVEWATYDHERPGVALADLAVGCVLVVCGAIAWGRRPQSRSGVLMSLSGFTWFLGTLFEPALFLHRGPLVHLHLSYPTGRLPTRLSRVVVALAYVDAAFEPLARNDALTLALSGAVALTAVQVFTRTSGPARKAGGPALAAALAFAGVLAFAAVGRQAGWDDTAILLVYDCVIASVVILLLVDLLRGRWADAVVTGLVLDLGAARETGTLRSTLAGALGDPALVIGYPLQGTDALVDDRGVPIEMPAPGSGKTETLIDDGDERLAVLIHDDALLADRHLVESVAAAARLAVANARLQAEARSRAAELEASRRRIVEAADAQRRRLEEELRLGAARRLEAVGSLLARARSGDGQLVPEIEVLERELDDARRELREFAQGVHPAALTEDGLGPAVALLAARSPLDVDVTGDVGRLPPAVEAALYFVCSEALANAVKHASASWVRVELRRDGPAVVVAVTDDGIGGADPAGGSGLRGLADRVEALGGRLRIESPRGGGTRLAARIPSPQLPVTREA
jgi:signal transduction histidine kinase